MSNFLPISCSPLHHQGKLPVHTIEHAYLGPVIRSTYSNFSSWVCFQIWVVTSGICEHAIAVDGACPHPKVGLSRTISEEEDEGRTWGSDMLELNMQTGLPMSAPKTSAARDMDEAWGEETEERCFAKAIHTFQHRS